MDPGKNWTPISNVWKNQTKNSEQVLKKERPNFRGLNFYYKFIGAGQKCSSASANCLQQKASELSMSQLDGKCGA